MKPIAPFSEDHRPADPLLLAADTALRRAAIKARERARTVASELNEATQADSARGGRNAERGMELLRKAGK